MKENKLSTKNLFLIGVIYQKAAYPPIISTDNLSYTDSPEIIAANTTYNDKTSILTFIILKK
ncbi:hypothetical protein B4147_5206 [Bacillus wiedmannii]|uniref:Uncharacterized protein n=1 Tax=Bacillus wiedmannii TaxID=1890302 RepID=A0A0G8C869_9BACI|nr:hypothetical protein B4147_5206 [Bacillus wiedmannii]